MREKERVSEFGPIAADAGELTDESRAVGGAERVVAAGPGRAYRARCVRRARRDAGERRAGRPQVRRRRPRKAAVRVRRVQSVAGGSSKLCRRPFSSPISQDSIYR